MKFHNQPPTTHRKKKRQFEIFLLQQTTRFQAVTTVAALCALALVAQRHLMPVRISTMHGTLLLLGAAILICTVVVANFATANLSTAENSTDWRNRLVKISGVGFGLLAFSLFGFLKPAEMFSASLVLCVVSVVFAALLYNVFESAVVVWVSIWVSAFVGAGDSEARSYVTFAAVASLALATLVSTFVRSVISFALSDHEESLALAARLHSTNQQLEMFFLAANHDLAQPLTAIQFGLRSINELTDQNSPAKQHIQMMLSAGQTLHRLVGDIVHYGKFASGKLDADATRAPLQQIFDRVVKETEQLTRTKNIGLWCRPSSRFISSGAFIVERIVRNLVENAIKYTHDGRVLIAARPRGDSVSIEVWDTGVGIDTANVDRVFDLFYQNMSPSGRPPGHGIGLTYVRASAAEIGATIEVHTKPGRGTVFKLVLDPSTCSHKQTAAQAQDCQNPPQQRPISWEGIRIAVLEDDYVLRSTICSTLVSQGASVIDAGSTVELLDKVRGLEHTLDVLLTDWNLGTDTGEAAAHALLQTPGFTATWIVISGDISETERKRLASAGITTIAKPLPPEKLARTIDLVLSARQKRIV